MGIEMIAPQTETELQICDELRRAKNARRAEYDQQRLALVELARQEKELAELQETELESITKMTDGVIAFGRKLLERRIVEPQVLPVTDNPVTDEDARRFAAGCAERVEFCLEG